jgi:hypothetical protein
VVLRIEDAVIEGALWCDTCRPHKSGHCDACHQPFNGKRLYQSASQHYHPGAVNGVAGMRAIYGDVCRECYLMDFAKVYPKEKLPVLVKDVSAQPAKAVGFGDRT